MGTQVIKHDLGLRSLFWSLWQQWLENKVISGRWSEYLSKPQPICEPQSESGCLVLQLWAFLLFMTIITGCLSLLKCEMLELRALFSWKRADGETKARYHVTVTASGFAADEWGISNQRESEGWLTDTARLQTVKLIPWEIFQTQLKRVLVIKEQTGSSDAEIQQHCRTAGQLHVSDWFLQRVTQQYDLLWPSHRFLIGLGTPVQFQSPF